MMAQTQTARRIALMFVAVLLFNLPANAAQKDETDVPNKERFNRYIVLIDNSESFKYDADIDQMLEEWRGKITFTQWQDIGLPQDQFHLISVDTFSEVIATLSYSEMQRSSPKFWRKKLENRAETSAKCSNYERAFKIVSRLTKGDESISAGKNILVVLGDMRHDFDPAGECGLGVGKTEDSLDIFPWHLLDNGATQTIALFLPSNKDLGLWLEKVDQKNLSSSAFSAREIGGSKNFELPIAPQWSRLPQTYEGPSFFKIIAYGFLTMLSGGLTIFGIIYLWKRKKAVPLSISPSYPPLEVVGENEEIAENRKQNPPPS